jgi:hypothetical protein
MVEVLAEVEVQEEVQLVSGAESQAGSLLLVEAVAHVWLEARVVRHLEVWAPARRMALEPLQEGEARPVAHPCYRSRN